MAIVIDGLRARGQTLRRLREIANVLFRHGFEAFIDRTPLARLVTPDCRRDVQEACRCQAGGQSCPCAHCLPLPERLRNAIVELGPTFIKIGQVASTRPDLVPSEYSQPLRTLQENVPPFSFEQVKSVVEEELGRPLAQLFHRFDEAPVASASLAQVHFARLPDGTPVAVKVQRPGIRQVIETDLAIMHWLARQLARLYPRVRNLRPQAAVEEFGKWTLRELEFRLEGKNLDEFRRNFTTRQDVIFPTVYWQHTTGRVLTMARVSGMRIDEVAARLPEAERAQLARRLQEIVLQMFITDAFFHADLHPGNVFFTADGRIVILDVGMVGRMSAEKQDRFLCYWVAITRRQRERAFYHLRQMALSTVGADLIAFRQRYDQILDLFYDAPLADRSLAQTYLEILLAGGEAGVIFPSEMLLQAKAIVTAEALDLVLYPQFEFSEEARPIVAREVARRASPGRLVDRVWSGLAEFILLGEAPPAGPATRRDEADERRFRREVLKALAYAWAEDVGETLRDKQADVYRYATSDYWFDHPEAHAALQTGLGFLHLLAMQLDNGLSASEPLAGASPAGNGAGLHAASSGDNRYQTFRQALDERGEKGRPYTADVRQTARYWRAESAAFSQESYWDDKQMLRAGLKSGLDLLRLFVGQLAQAVEASQQEDEALSEILDARARADGE